ncbi:hypothetical protein [Mesorhizobium sp. LNJC391B00]|uniref:hypothetical protein n=1 Tax=Mesorhizobium sp. LNJC391B00 TaxID=1287273 RepID=UPI0012EB2C16|nr:hypothetical protein [Mesorhizobium sp. LNJC391B00]
MRAELAWHFVPFSKIVNGRAQSLSSRLSAVVTVAQRKIKNHANLADKAEEEALQLLFRYLT